ncbi:MAG: EAL domain-containing protein [Paraglaciecola sp.]|nr:EAL domain-containing protein [Paraglaciecola sp.]NCT46744.1 EAL domain-containing protein [Paraglaciecola sp.]
MTLSRQLALGLFAILAMVFAGALFINVHNTKNYIAQQLTSHAQDTATSLGLSIAPYLGSGSDLPVVDTMMNAIFDRGYYQSMVLSDMAGNIILEKHNPTRLEGVPLWFKHWFVLEPPLTQTEINNGWNIVGLLAVQSHPGIAYQQLWRNSIDAFWLICWIFVFALMLVWLLVRVITVPINAVVKQAQAISEQRFERLELSPRTPELRTFVDAINRMSERLSEMFARLTAQAHRYKEFAYVDALTKVGNRRAFDLAVDQLLSDDEQQSHGCLLIVRLSSLYQVNQHYGFADGDKYVTSVCSILVEQCQQRSASFHVYRLSGADFAVIAEDAVEAEIVQFIDVFMQSCRLIDKSEYQAGIVHLGAGSFAYGTHKSQLLEKIDHALNIALTQAHRWQFANDSLPVANNSQWRDQFQRLLAEKHTNFAAQPIKSFDNTTLYSELFARFADSQTGEYIPMAELIPASIRLDFAQQIDELVLACALKNLAKVEGNIGVNVSRLTVLQVSFQEWWLAQLAHLGANCAKLVLEIPESALLNNSALLLQFIARVRQFGVKITIERFGAQLATLTQLRVIRPDYLKLDGRYIRHIDREVDNQLFVNALVGIAHGLNVKIIAERVETRAEAECLQGMQVDFIQGYYVGRPSPM